jgi:hypothetical protein
MDDGQQRQQQVQAKTVEYDEYEFDDEYNNYDKTDVDKRQVRQVGGGVRPVRQV